MFEPLFLSILMITIGGKTISGKVYDYNSKNTLPLVNILVEGTNIGTFTDSNGYYKIEIPDSLSSVVLRYTMIGYEKKRKEIRTDKGKIISVDIEMRMKPLAAQGVLITARKEDFRESSSITAPSLSQKNLMFLPSLIQSDLMRTIEMMSGITKVSDFTNSISVRGGAPDQNLILIDNVPILKPSHLFGIVSTYNTDVVEKAKLYKSGISARYDDMLSSVLDIRTKGLESKAEGFTGNISSSFLSSKITLGSKIPIINGNILISVRRSYVDKLLKLFDYDLPYYFYDGHLNLESNLGNWLFTLSTYKGKDFLKYKLYYNKEEDSLYTVADVNWDNSLFSLGAFYPCGEGSLLHFSAGFSEYKSLQNFSDSIVDSKTKIKIFTTAADYSHKFNKHKVTIGLYDYLKPFDYELSVQTGFRYKLEDKLSNRASLFVEDQISAWKDLLLKGGIAFNHYYSKGDSINSSNSKVLTTYRLSCKYFLNDLTAFVLSFGNYHQYQVPAAIEVKETLVITPISIKLPLYGKYEPEKARHLNAGFEGWFSESFYFSIEGYYRYYNHLLQMKEKFKNIDIQNTQSLYETVFESGTGNTWGADFTLKKEKGKLSGWLSYTFLKSEVSFDTLTYIPDWERTHNFHAALLARLGWGLVSGLQFSFSTGNPYTGATGRFYRKLPYPHHPVFTEEDDWGILKGRKNNERFPPYIRLDLSLSRCFYLEDKELEIKFSIYNITNHKNVFFYYYDYSNSNQNPPTKESFNMLPIVPSIEIKYKF